MQLLIGHSRSVWLWGATVCTEYLLCTMAGLSTTYQYILHTIEEWITTESSMWDQLHQLNDNKDALVVFCSFSALYH